MIHDSSIDNPSCAPHCCYNKNEWPLKQLSLEECKLFCKEKEYCTRADWYPKEGRRSMTECYVYSSEASTNCCNDCFADGPNWISCAAT